MKVLVTGGTGYIGSHTCLSLATAGHDITVVDNFSNSNDKSIRRVSELTGVPIGIVNCDVRSPEAMTSVFERVTPDAVIHFAGLKSVSESVRLPDSYYETNVGGTLNVARAALHVGVSVFLFSSSATVYAESAAMPVNEDAPTSPSNPYGRSKLYAESLLRDLYASQTDMSTGILRYFNPVGAHPSGQIGENPKGTPANLMPFVARVADGTYPKLKIFGNDYPTTDGTGVRDYIHVMDLACAHVQTMEHMSKNPGFEVWNVGRGVGLSVKEMVTHFERITGKKVPFTFESRRPGDVAVSYADVRRIQAAIGWSARHGVDDMVSDLWRWQSQNPLGYG